MQRQNGVLVFWSDYKKYGYIRPSKGGRNVFLHGKDIDPLSRLPRLNDQMTYVVVNADSECPTAVDARVCTFSWSFSLLLAAGVTPFVGLYACAVWRNMIPLYPPFIAYLCMSLITVIVCHHDRKAAQTGAWRVSDGTLHILEFLGGWPGSLMANVIFRDRLRMVRYQIVFWLIVLAHGAGWYILTSGTKILDRTWSLPDVQDEMANLARTLVAPKVAPSPEPSAPRPAVATAPAAPSVHAPSSAPPDLPAPPHAASVPPVLQAAPSDTLIRQIQRESSYTQDFALSDFLGSLLRAYRGATNRVPDRPAPPLFTLPETTSPSLPPSVPISELWLADPPTEPPLSEPGVNRSVARLPEQARLLTGTVRAISRSNGLLVALPLEFDVDGVIDPSTLVTDFHRRFKVGERVTVAVQKISMRGRIKQVDLLLADR